MVPSLRPLLFGRTLSPRRRYVSLSLIVVVFGFTFVAYALDVFQVSGGVVFLAGHAALVGFLGAILIGYRHSGLLTAWGVSYAAFLGYSADHNFLGLSHRPILDRAAAFFQLDGLVFLGIEALVIGTIGFLIGWVCHWGVGVVQRNTTRSVAR